MSVQQLPTHVLQHLESIKKELNEVAKELSDSPLQARLLKLSDRVETLVVDTYEMAKTPNMTQKNEDPQGKEESCTAGAEEKFDSSEKEQNPLDVFLASPSTKDSNKIKNVKRNRHERGASRHQRVLSRNSTADFEGMVGLTPDNPSSDEDDRNEENQETGIEDEEVGNPVPVSVTLGSNYHHEENISLQGVKDVTSEGPVVFPAPAKIGFTKEHLRNMSFGGVMQVGGSSNDEEMKRAKQIQEIIGGSKEDEVASERLRRIFSNEEDQVDLEEKLFHVKTSKIDLVKSTAEEITRLREIIKRLASQLRDLRIEYKKLLNPSFGGQIFGAVASLFYTRSQ